MRGRVFVGLFFKCAGDSIARVRVSMDLWAFVGCLYSRLKYAFPFCTKKLIEK